MKPALILILLFLVACTPTEEFPTISIDESVRSCFGFETETSLEFSCTADETHAFIETEEAEILFRGYDSSIVIRGTVEILRQEHVFIIRVAEGTAVISARGRTRVIPEGSQLEIAITDGVMQAPSDFIPTQSSQSPANNQEIAQLSPTATFEGDCSPREDWGVLYTVKAGDVLEEIGEAYGLTVRELAEANCLTDPSRLRIGQVLRIAGDSPTVTPSAIAFRADAFTIQVGDCTTLRWDVFNVAAVYIDDLETSANNFIEVCPEATTSYTLRITFLDETETTREITITVENN